MVASRATLVEVAGCQVAADANNGVCRNPTRRGSQNPLRTLLVRGDDAQRASHDLTASLGRFAQLHLDRRDGAFRLDPSEIR